MKVTNNYDHPPPSQHTLTKEESRKLPSSKLLLPDVYRYRNFVNFYISFIGKANLMEIYVYKFNNTITS